MRNDDDINDRFQRRMRRISDGAIADLHDHQWFYPPNLLKPNHIVGDKKGILDKTTAIGSIGSCFAREIKNYLQCNGYNYINYGEGKRASHGSAAWERVFNTACIKQEIQRAAGSVDRHYTQGLDGNYYDLGRKNTSFASLEEAKEEEREYVRCARKAIEDSEIFVITLGLSEIWFDTSTDMILAESPPKTAYDENRHVFKILSPESNADNLRSALEALWSVNSEMNIIVTVSPVPLRATFVRRSAAVSNNVSKASLIFAAHVICEEFENVLYFPSYEIVQYLATDPFGWDGRHVNASAVDLIMSQFVQKFER